MLAKLIDLDPEFLRFDGATNGLIEVSELSDSQAVIFNCPKCESSHSILVAFRDCGVLDHQGTHDNTGRPTRWGVSGSGFDNLTLTPSVDCTPSDPNCWHGHVTNGEVT